MRQFTTTHTVYKFEELEREAQERALNDFRERESFNWLTDELQEELARLLKQHGLKYDELPRLYYSLNYSQGDGAMFEGTVYWKSYTATIRQSGYYYHFNSKSFDLESTKTGKDATVERYAEFDDLYIDICRELERTGYQIIEDASSDESIKELIEVNGYEFYSDGRLA